MSDAVCRCDWENLENGICYNAHNAIVGRHLRARDASTARRRTRHVTRIAFCDDDNKILRELRAMTDKYCASRDRTLRVSSYESTLDLLAATEQGARFDVLFLDILMPGENGMDAAEEIRARNDDVRIIFLTSSEDYAVRSYAVGAYYYQMKPMHEDAFFHLLDAVLADREKEEDLGLLLHTRSGISRIALRDLEYCEVIHRTLFFHLVDGTVIDATGRMDDLEKRLTPADGFMRVHRSYLASLRHIRKLSAKVLDMASGARIPVPRGRFADIRDAFLKSAFESGELTL